MVWKAVRASLTSRQDRRCSALRFRTFLPAGVLHRSGFSGSRNRPLDPKRALVSARATAHSRSVAQKGLRPAHTAGDSPSSCCPNRQVQEPVSAEDRRDEGGRDQDSAAREPAPADGDEPGRTPARAVGSVPATGLRRQYALAGILPTGWFLQPGPVDAPYLLGAAPSMFLAEPGVNRASMAVRWGERSPEPCGHGVPGGTGSRWRGRTPPAAKALAALSVPVHPLWGGAAPWALAATVHPAEHRESAY